MPDKKEVKTKKEVKKFPYSMAPGKSITSRRGIVGPGEEVRAEWFVGGKDTIEKCVKSGHIVKA